MEGACLFFCGLGGGGAWNFETQLRGGYEFSELWNSNTPKIMNNCSLNDIIHFAANIIPFKSNVYTFQTFNIQHLNMTLFMMTVL